MLEYSGKEIYLVCAAADMRKGPDKPGGNRSSEIYL